MTPQGESDNPAPGEHASEDRDDEATPTPRAVARTWADDISDEDWDRQW